LRLNLFFIAMDLVTILAAPFVLLYGKIHQFSKSKETITSAK